MPRGALPPPHVHTFSLTTFVLNKHVIICLYSSILKTKCRTFWWALCVLGLPVSRNSFRNWLAWTHSLPVACCSILAWPWKVRLKSDSSFPAKPTRDDQLFSAPTLLKTDKYSAMLGRKVLFKVFAFFLNKRPLSIISIFPSV